MLKVYEFGDYHLFLKSYFAERKKTQKHFSMRVWGRQLDVKSPATLSMILNGQRVPGPSLVEKLITYFRFNRREAEYFRALVALDKIPLDRPERRKFLQTVQANQVGEGQRIIELEVFESISNWYYLAIREMASLRGFRPSPEWIQSKLRFKVPAPSIRKALTRLVNLGLLSKKSDGFLEKTDDEITTTFGIPHAAIKAYHSETLDLAKRALFEVPVSDRYISSSNFCIDTKDISKIKEELRKAQEEIMRTFEKSQGNAVYSVGFIFIPLTSATDQNHQEAK